VSLQENNLFAGLVLVLVGIGTIALLINMNLIFWSIAEVINPTYFSLEEAQQCKYIVKESALEEYSEFWVFASDNILSKEKFELTLKKCRMEAGFFSQTYSSNRKDSCYNGNAFVPCVDYCKSFGNPVWVCVEKRIK